MKESCLLCTVLCCMSTSAQASFMGNTVTAEWLYPDASSVLESHEVVVNGGVELPSGTILNAGQLGIDIGDDFILFSWDSSTTWSNRPANGWQFSDTFGSIAKITGFTIGATTGVVTGLEASDLSFTSDSVFANFGASGSNLTIQGVSTIRLDVEFGAVPIPPALWLFGSGLLGLMGASTRKKVAYP